MHISTKFKEHTAEAVKDTLSSDKYYQADYIRLRLRTDWKYMLRYDSKK